jgi:hypothetical protein
MKAATRLEMARAVLTVGDGRGFVVQGEYQRYIITAAHCLPHMPPPHRAAYAEEGTYWKLLSEIGRKPSVPAACFFVDPVGDIAILGTPDTQTFYDEAEAYDDLVNSVTPIPVSDSAEPGTAWVLSLDGVWLKQSVKIPSPGNLWIDTPPEGGMSGSPILSDAGAAIGVVVISDGSAPSLLNLPAYYVNELISIGKRQRALKRSHPKRPITT